MQWAKSLVPRKEILNVRGSCVNLSKLMDFSHLKWRQELEILTAI